MIRTIKIGILVATASLTFHSWALAAEEPAFCSKLEQTPQLVTPARSAAFKKLGRDGDRIRVYKFGKVTITGAPIGSFSKKDPKNVTDLQTEFAPGGVATNRPKHCVWYVNEGSEHAEKEFNWLYVPRPGEKGAREKYDELFTRMASQRTSSTAADTDLLSCVEAGYLAIGCNGQRHRGPTAFAGFLAMAGCRPEKVALFVNRVWGLNGVKPQDRLARIQQAYEIGQKPENTELRTRLAAALSSSNETTQSHPAAYDGTSAKGSQPAATSGTSSTEQKTGIAR
jgi:hypothetical protein